MGSAPHSASLADPIPALSPLTPDSSAFLQQVRSIKVTPSPLSATAARQSSNGLQRKPSSK